MASRMFVWKGIANHRFRSFRNQNKIVEDNFVGFIIADILDLVAQLEFVTFSFVKREGDMVAHKLAHWLPV